MWLRTRELAIIFYYFMLYNTFAKIHTYFYLKASGVHFFLKKYNYEKSIES